MNLELKDGLQLIEKVQKRIQKIEGEHIEIVFAPPFIHLAPANDIINDNRISLAGQDCSAHESGAYTGEVSAAMLRSTGSELVILGHSERRAYHRENEELLSKKLHQAWNNNLLPILCVGENLDQRKAGEESKVVEQQLAGALKGVQESWLENLIIAYEPVWAIGTGETATPEQAQAMHGFIRNYFRTNYSAILSDEISILYGGSVKPANARDIFGQPDVDGGLIGGASLKVEDFCQLIETGEAVLR